MTRSQSDNGELGNDKQTTQSGQVQSGKNAKLGCLPLLAIVAAVMLCAIFVMPKLKAKSTTRFFAESDLVSAVGVSKLLANDYEYHGIAEKRGWLFDNREYCIKYVAHVNASFDTSKIEFEIDPDAKAITVFIPKPVIETQLEEGQFDFLPEGAPGKFVDVVGICKQDAADEVGKTGQITETAYKSVEETIEWLISPITDDDYSINFKHVEGE